MGKTLAFDTLAYATKQGIKELEYRPTIRIGGILVVTVGILLAAKLFA